MDDVLASRKKVSVLCRRSMEDVTTAKLSCIQDFEELDQRQEVD